MFVPKQQKSTNLRSRQPSTSSGTGSDKSLTSSLPSSELQTKSKKNFGLNFKPRKLFRSMTKGLSSSKSVSLSDISTLHRSKKSDSLPNIQQIDSKGKGDGHYIFRLPRFQAVKHDNYNKVSFFWSYIFRYFHFWPL